MTNIAEDQFPKIKITHVPTGKIVKFNAYIERFSDNFNSQWDSTEVFGRMDDIRNFKKTTRTIDLGWTVISENIDSASENYNNCSTLMAMLYPVYSSTNVVTADASPLEIDLTDEQEVLVNGTIEEIENARGQSISDSVRQNIEFNVSNILSSVADNVKTRTLGQTNQKSREASVMNSPPIFKINFANLIRNGGKDDKELYGTIEGFKYEPDLEMGFFIDGQGDEQMMYPKVVSLSFAFTVIHTNPLGWSYKDGKYEIRNPDFPFYKKK